MKILLLLVLLTFAPCIQANSIACEIYLANARAVIEEGGDLDWEAVMSSVQMCRYKEQAWAEFQRAMKSPNAGTDEALRLRRSFMLTPIPTIGE